MINELYNQLTFEEIVRTRYFARGASPSFSQIEAIMGQVEAKKLGVNGSSLNYKPSSESEGSAKVIQDALDTFSRELQTIFGGSALLKDQAKRLYDRAENRAALVNKQAMDLALEACALAQGRQEGFNLFAWDCMVDLTKTDQSVTSITVDPRSQAGRLKTRPNERRIPLSHLEDKDFEVIVILGDVSGQSLAPDSRLKNAVDDSDSYWMHRINSMSDGAKGVALQVDLGAQIAVSRLSFSPFGANTDAGLQVRVLGSLNLVNWRELMPITQQTSPRIQIDSVAINVRYLRIEMTRQTPSYQTQDLAGFIYEFGMNDLRVFESLYYPTGQFISKAIEFRDVIGNLQLVNRIKFNFYDEKPEGTEIIYYLVVDPTSTEGLIRIVPNVETELPTVLSKKEDQGKIRSRYDTNHALVSLKLESGFIPETVQFFRNTFQDGVLIDGIQTGWKFKDSYFSCMVEVAEEKEINLGVSFAYIDGKKTNGIQVLSPGLHSFRTHETNWRPAISESDDPLFPYNHKLIIEGLKNSKIYTGVDFQAAENLSLISAFDLIENIPNTNDQYFGIYGSYPMVKIPVPPVFLERIEGWRLEQYAIRYKYVSDTVTPITSVRLVARMSTTNPRLSPVFRGYIALAGF